MNRSKNNKPKIRFKGFTEDWKLKKIGGFVKITMGQSPNGINYTNNPNDAILVQGNADMKNGKVVPRVWTKQITKTADLGDIIFSVRAPVGEVGRTFFNVVIGRGVAAIKGDEFLFQALKKMNEDNYWKKLSAGSTFESINSNELSNAEILIPLVAEQTQIGNFFENLDQLITEHQQKHAKLKALKQAMLGKMFPKQGQLVPEIRFKGFEGEWIQSDLKDILSFQYGIFNNNPSNGGEYPVYGANGVIGRYSEYNASDSVVIGHMGEYAGIVLWVDGKHFVTYNGIITKPKNEKLLSKFGYFMLYKMDLRKICDGSGQPFLSYNILNKLKGIYPESHDEQNQISNYFKNLDKLIDNHDTQITKLQNLKKAFLAKMFI